MEPSIKHVILPKKKKKKKKKKHRSTEKVWSTEFTHTQFKMFSIVVKAHVESSMSDN